MTFEDGSSYEIIPKHESGELSLRWRGLDEPAKWIIGTAFLATFGCALVLIMTLAIRGIDALTVHHKQHYCYSGVYKVYPANVNQYLTVVCNNGSSYQP